jgi:hypothetical protein
MGRSPVLFWASIVTIMVVILLTDRVIARIADRRRARTACSPG